jgi:hypothetical protein
MVDAPLARMGREVTRHATVVAIPGEFCVGSQGVERIMLTDELFEVGEEAFE